MKKRKEKSNGQKQNCILSKPMEQSKRYKDIISLGKRIVEELGLQDSVDTLGRWMSHYLGELILDAERESSLKSRKAVQKECVDLILTLWKSRENLPTCAQPLGHLVPVLKTIETLQDNREPWVQKARESTAQGKDVWCTFAKESYSADRRMCVIALQTAVAESYFDRAKRWSKEMPNHLSNNEKAIIDNLDAWLSTKRDWASTDTKKSITDLSPSNRIEVILGELEASVGRQVAALKQLKESLREHREEGRDLKGET